MMNTLTLRENSACSEETTHRRSPVSICSVYVQRYVLACYILALVCFLNCYVLSKHIYGVGNFSYLLADISGAFLLLHVKTCTIKDPAQHTRAGLGYGCPRFKRFLFLFSLAVAQVKGTDITDMRHIEEI